MRSLLMLMFFLYVPTAWSAPAPAPRPMITMPRVTLPPPPPRVMAPAPGRPANSVVTTAKTAPYMHNGIMHTPMYQNNMLVMVIWMTILNGKTTEVRADCLKPANDHDRKVCERARKQ